MGSRAGALKQAAAKAGVSLDEYTARRDAGLKRCTDCGEWRLAASFAKDRSRYDGLAARCTDCASERGRAAYTPVPADQRRVPGPARISARDGDKLQARRRINHDVRLGLRPDPDDLHCARCGHKGPDRRHEYHHHMGYEAAHYNDVLPLCSACHSEAHHG